MRVCVCEREREENFDYFVEQNWICDPFSWNESELKIWQFEILHVSNLQVLLVTLILKSHFYSKKCGFDVFLKDAGVAEAILRKSALKFSEHVSANTPEFNAYRL